MRLLLGAGLWLCVALVGSWLALTALFRDHLDAQLRETLKTHLDQLAASLILGSGGGLLDVKPLSDPRFARPYGGLYWQAEQGDAGEGGPGSTSSSTSTGPTVRRSRSLWDRALALPADHPVAGEVHRHELPGPSDEPLIALERTILPPAGPFIRLAVAVDARALEEPLVRFGHAMAVSLFVVGVGILLAALAQVALGLRPLGRLRTALAALRSGGERRITGRWPVELLPLIEDLNALLEADGELLARSRTHAGNLAHALKTPLSLIMNRVEALAPEVPPAVRAELTADLETIRRQIEYHLTRARAAGPPSVAGLSTDVRPQLLSLIGIIRRAYLGSGSVSGSVPLSDSDPFGDRSLDIALAAPVGVRAPCEVQDFNEMAGNLLDNAAKWAKGRIAVSAGVGPGGFVLTVEDDGPGLDDEAAALAVERGWRLDESVPGTGLGLAIVRDMVGLYGGRLVLDRSPGLGGARVALTLPLGAVATRLVPRSP